MGKYRVAAKFPGDKYGHIAAERLGKIVDECKKVHRWLHDMKKRFWSQPKYEIPVLLCADMEKKNQELAKMANDILKEPKPPPPKPEKEEVTPAPTPQPTPVPPQACATAAKPLHSSAQAMMGAYAITSIAPA